MITETQKQSLLICAEACGFPEFFLHGTSQRTVRGRDGWHGLVNGRAVLPYDLQTAERGLDAHEAKRAEIERGRTEPGVGEAADEFLAAELDALIAEDATEARHERTVEDRLDKLIKINERIADRLARAG
jgi:hypothetical protein